MTHACGGQTNARENVTSDASSESRSKLLWLELSEPVDDNRTAYFARVLWNTPDPLIARNNPVSTAADEAEMHEPALPVRIEGEA